MNALFPIEIAGRELDSKALLAYEFATKNHVSYIGDKNSVLKFSRYVPNAVYFDKGYHKGVSEFIYKKLAVNNINLISLDEENAVDYHDFQQLDVRFPNHILNKFDLIFLWGSKQYQYLKINRSCFDTSITFQTGHPRFELLKKKNRSIYQDKARELKEKYGNFVLINTNFGLGNNSKGKEFVISNYGSRFPQIKEIISYQEKQVKLFIGLSITLSKNIEKTIILRPHPEEDIYLYKNILSKYKNIKVIRDGSVIPWIMASSSMVHHDCTTGIESAMLGKNSIAYAKNLNKELTTDIPLRISYQYDNSSDVISHIRSEEAKLIKIDNSILRDYFSFDHNSIGQIIEKTLEIFGENNTFTKNYFIYSLASFFKDKSKWFLKKNTFYEDKIQGLDFNNVQVVVNKYNRLYGGNVVVRKISSRLFQLKES